MLTWARFAGRTGRGLLRVPPGDAAILAEAAILLAAAQLVVRLLPFRLLLRRLRTTARVEPAAAGPSRAVRRVRWAVDTAAARVPWSAPCLPQALAARLMLRWRGVPTTLHLGVGKDSKDALAAHAWLCAGSVVVTGRPGHRSFAEVARFA